MIALLLLLAGCGTATVRVDEPSIGSSAASVPSDLIYFVLVDRFANGDTSNDGASPGPAVDLSDPQGWHGGDLRGVIDHLDDIARLGVNTVWLSPVFTTRTTPIGAWGAYHGYWQWDPGTVEPRFGTESELVELADALRDRNMGLLLDLVTNHVGYDAPLARTHPGWFHHEPSIQDWNDPDQLENGQVHGLPDLDQDNPELAAWLTRNALHWQAMLHPRGFRVDAVRHIPNAFLLDLGQALMRHNPGLWWLGEDFTGDIGVLAHSQRSGGFTHVFDFPLYYAMTDVFCDDAPPARLASLLWQDRRYVRPQGLVTFLDNHDLPRIQSRCHGQEQRVERALRFLFATRGVPALSYGTESGLRGAKEPENRGDMVFEDSPLRELITKLATQRAKNPAMRGGVQRVIHLDSDSMAVARVAGDQAVVVGISRSDAPTQISLPADLATAMGPEPGTLSIPAHGVAVWTLSGSLPDWSAQGPDVLVPVHVIGAPEGQVRLVGATAALGSWQPARGLVLACSAGACEGSLTVPAGAVLEGKPVLFSDSDGGADPAATWADGENRAMLVAPGVRWDMSW